MPNYNKLVRDKIPEIIEASGQKCITEVLDNDLYLEMLDKKLGEEVSEYCESHNIEELADILEVVYACAISRGMTLEELERIRLEKYNKRGGFEKKILLKVVTE